MRIAGWTIQNTFKNSGSSGTSQGTPLHMMPNNIFAISATPAGGKQQAFVLATPASYTEANCRKDTSEPSHVTPEQVQRLQDLPGIKGLSMTAKYPVCEVDYEIPGCPVYVIFMMQILAFLPTLSFFLVCFSPLACVFIHFTVNFGDGVQTEK